MSFDIARIHHGQASVLAELSLLRSTVNKRLTDILARGDARGAEEAAIACRWLSDNTVPANRLAARAEGIARFLGGRTHG